MSVNRYQPHVMVLPEDDANRQLVNGFLLSESLSTRQIQVLPVAGGWMEVLDRFKSDHVSEMDKYPDRLMVLLIDFDSRNDRLDSAKAAIPVRLIDRVLILGVWSEPERLRTNLGGRSYEQIGREMAHDCRDESDVIWGHELLRHNTSEMDRFRDRFRPILFQST